MNPLNLQKKVLYIVCIVSIVLLFTNGIVMIVKGKETNHLKAINQKLVEHLGLNEYSDSVEIAAQALDLTVLGAEFKTIDSQPVLLKELIEDHTLIFKYSEFSCTQCVEQELALLKKEMELIGKQNVIVLTDYSDPTQLYRFLRINKLEGVNVCLFERNAFDLFEDEVVSSYYFILDDRLNLKSLFVPYDKYSERTLQYYDIINFHFFLK